MTEYGFGRRYGFNGQAFQAVSCLDRWEVRVLHMAFLVDTREYESFSYCSFNMIDFRL